MSYEGSVLGDEDEPFTTRPDLDWATWRDLWYALYIKPYPESKFGYVTRHVQNQSAEWIIWRQKWCAWYEAKKQGIEPTKPLTPSWFREEVEVELHWVRAELEDRREANLQQSLRAIKKTPTRELLGWLQSARACGGWWSPVDKNSEYGHKFDDIKAELDTREHIPNKKEARALRREAALQHRKNKRRPVAQRLRAAAL